MEASILKSSLYFFIAYYKKFRYLMAFHDKESIKLSKVGAIEITQW